jgi:mono/diheme cytochrome c family protein
VRRVRLAVLVLVIAALGAVGWIVFGPGPLSFAGGTTVALDDYKGPSPTGVPPSLASTSLVTKGKYLAEAADCEACHTVPGHPRYTGGLAFRLPFGTLYSPNITADKDTGIGGWSDADFLKAVHKGIAPDGTRLYPAFPYAAYTMMTDEDALAIKAYLFSLPSVHAKAPDADLAFPFNQRWLMIFWSLFFDPDTRFQPNTGRSAAWNRGAYLTEAMGHCGDCHTPRNLLMALDNRGKFKGAIAAGWKAYNITQDKDSGIGTLGAMTRWRSISVPVMPSAMALPRARWARRWITASAISCLTTSRRSSSICAPFPRSPIRLCPSPKWRQQPRLQRQAPQ